MEANLFDRYYSRLEEVKDEIHQSDFRFYNISHFPLIIKNTIEKAQTCESCRENLKLTQELMDSIPKCFENPGDRKKFERKKNKIERHLKKEHGMKFPGYYTALLSLLGTLAGTVVAISLHWAKGIPFFNEFILIILALGIILGRGFGALMDKRVFSKNLQL